MKLSNFLIFIISLSVLIYLQSYSHFSTSLSAILPDDESKEMITNFHKTQNNKVLLLAVKGFDAKALEKIQRLEKELTAFHFINRKQMLANDSFQKHQEEYKLFSHKINEDKLSKLDANKTLNALYKEMTTSFFPVNIDKIDPFKLLNTPESATLKSVNSHLVLGDYGYLSIFNLGSQTFDEDKKVYQYIHTVLDDEVGIEFFSPAFYYVENSQAITSDSNTIVIIAIAILLLLYLIMLRDILLLLNTLITLATSAIVATIVLTQIFDEVSVFVFVFGLSISTVAIDYMFHHYLHGYYASKKTYNREVLFGYLTTFSAFFILSFTSFLLIKQIALFSLISLSISYLQFSFLYPRIGFRVYESKSNAMNMNIHLLDTKIVFAVSIMVIMASSSWIHFDFNLKNLDYDNKTLQKAEDFFSDQSEAHQKMTFALKAESIDYLIMQAQTIEQNVASTKIPISSLVSHQSYNNNKAILESMSPVKVTLLLEAAKLGFKKEYFKQAYGSDKPFMPYTEEVVKSYGLDIAKVNGSYMTYGTVNKNLYQEVLAFKSVESLSLKERFEDSIKKSITMLIKLGILALAVIIVLLYFITREAMLYALTFLVYPVAMVSLYAYFTEINILHIFMLFVLLSIGIDYAIYLSKQNDNLTQKSILYSLISTFAGFGVLIFSSINALFSMGIVATIGIVCIFVLLVFLKGVNDAS